MTIPFSKVDCSGRERDLVCEVIESGWLTTASKVQLFEKQFLETVGASYACAVNSCTAALHLGLEALGVRPGDRVLVPSMTFTASAEVIRYLNADPIFLDVDYETRLLTPEIVENALNRHPDVKVLVIVHFGGQVAAMPDLDDQEGILSICRRHGVKIIEDAAHAFPSRIGERYVGSFGDITCFSFYANKTITTGEGGMLLTEDEEIYKRVKTMRLHGINRDIWDRFTDKNSAWEYDVIAPGYKYNMPDINAAIGIAQLERAHEFREGRQKCADYYDDALEGIECLDLPLCLRERENHSWHLYPIVLNEKSLVTRNFFIERLKERGVGTSVHYKPLHRMTYYREYYSLEPKDFPNTERIWEGTVSLPIYFGMRNGELEFVVESIKEILQGNN
ncbi:DegT/DnrJ/EryC1/StrS family aminotransferase [bacterium]|nr:DegT/DnrJ/EryC1/StrS family aminotransferase [bacterium]